MKIAYRNIFNNDFNIFNIFLTIFNISGDFKVCLMGLFNVNINVTVVNSMNSNSCDRKLHNFLQQ